ncbi:MAG: hypothetical protein AAGH64_05810 [Planctomycetota bacterium]
MGLSSILKPQRTLVGVDLGAHTMKALQLAPNNLSVDHAAAIETPPELRADPNARLRWQFDHLPELIKQGRFTGKRAAVAIPAERTIVENIAVAKAQGVSTTDMLAEKLRSATGLEPNTLVVRHEEVGDVTRNGAKSTETLCFAIPRAIVKDHMRALKKCGLDTVGVHCQHAAIARAARACENDAEDASTLFLDLGVTGVRAIVAKQGALIASRTIAADLLEAAAPPQVLAPTGTDNTPVTMPSPSFMGSSPLDAVAEELGQLARYCAAVRPDAPVKSVVFVGGLSTSDTLCADLAKRLRLPAHAADPVSHLPWAKKPGAGAPDPSEPKPAWTVALGLCLSPTDL